MKNLPSDRAVLPGGYRVRALLLACCALGLAGCSAVVLDPAGEIAARQARLLVISTGLMLLVIVPVIALTLAFAWRYRASNQEAAYTPDWDHSIQLELLIWSVPLLIVIALGALTWIGTHTLDPYRPLEPAADGAARPTLEVQVVALDWKWLFIYPQQGVATVNELAIPVDMPVRFSITAASVMNSFFVPALAGQIYAMPAMETKLHAVINRAGEYEGFSANYSGAGFSAMRFKLLGLGAAEFESWLQKAKAAGQPLSREAYLQLQRPSEGDAVRQYAGVAPGLFDAVVNRCVEPGSRCVHAVMLADARRAAAAYAGTTQWGEQRPDAFVCTAANSATFAALAETGGK